MGTRETRKNALVLTLGQLCIRSIDRVLQTTQSTRTPEHQFESLLMLLSEFVAALKRWQQNRISDLQEPAVLDCDAFDSGYKNGWNDAMKNVDEAAEPLAWAIVCSRRKKVRFETTVPDAVKQGEVVIALYARP